VKKNILSNSASLLFSRVVQMILQVFMGIIIPKLVAPLQYGLWRSLLLITQYNGFSNLGTYQAMSIEIPYFRGKNNLDKYSDVKNNTFYFNVIISFFLAFVLIISSFFISGENESFYRSGFLLFSVLIISANIADFYLQFLRAEKDFSLLSKLTVLQASVNLFLSLGLLLYFDYVLFLAFAIIISNSLLIYFAILKNGLPNFIKIRYKEISRLISFGFPILLSGILFELIRGIDQLLIVFFLNPEQFGYYALAVSIQRIGYLVPGVLASTTMPYINEEYGRSSNFSEISKIYEKSLKLMSIICSLVLVMIYIFFPLLFKYYLIEYQESVPILNVLVIGMFSFGLLGLPGNLIAITNKTINLIKWQISTLSISSILILITLKFNYGIFEISIISVIMHFIYTVGNLYLGYKIYILKSKIILKKIMHLFFPYLYLLISLMLVNLFIKIEINTFIEDLVSSIIKAIVVIIMFIPILYIYEKDLKVYNNIIDYLKSFRA
tara:strand:+ start:9332 stop:10816 length:1485 start_codon:yes stop_codon:yes gene_type:complete